MEPKRAVIGCWEPHPVVCRPMRGHGGRGSVLSIGAADVTICVVVLRLRVRTRASRGLLGDGLVVGERVRTCVTVVGERHTITVFKARN